MRLRPTHRKAKERLLVKWTEKHRSTRSSCWLSHIFFKWRRSKIIWSPSEELQFTVKFLFCFRSKECQRKCPSQAPRATCEDAQEVPGINMSITTDSEELASVTSLEHSSGVTCPSHHKTLINKMINCKFIHGFRWTPKNRLQSQLCPRPTYLSHSDFDRLMMPVLRQTKAIDAKYWRFRMGEKKKRNK